MNPSTENDLFGVTLTPSGSTYLLKLYPLARMIFIGIILITLITIADVWMQNRMYTQRYGELDWLSFLSMNVYPIYSVVITVITLVQVYFFLHFSRLCNLAIRQQQTDLFNTSFKWLYRNTICACIMLIIEVIGRGFFLYGKYWVTQHMPLK